MSTPLAVNLNSPGSYVTWNIFTVSVANLVLIAVMVAIFGAALLLPFPGRRKLEVRFHGAPVAPSPGTSPGPAADAPAAPPSTAQASTTQASTTHTSTAKTSTIEASVAETSTAETSTAQASTVDREALGADEDAGMWTSRVRRLTLRLLPPGKLLPDRQPAYVASWVYVFGVATLAALAMAIISGFTIALGGTDWWHTNPVGHFFNSLHLWSVELFMAFMVIHLWGKFWMAAWRGRRALTWITGVVAFGASILECFTGYLSQQNFDSQWIATNGKDAFNAVGVGAFFNLMNVGQMLLWHVVLIPVILIALVGAHVLLVRVRGVSHPLPAQYPSARGLLSRNGRAGLWAARKAQKAADTAAWRGPTRRYDILKEATIACGIAAALTIALAAIVSSPDVPPVTVRSWVQAAPADFLATAASELNGTSHTATYGPPYNTNGTPQSELFAPASITGVTQSLDPAQAFVLTPLAKAAPTDPRLAAALSQYNAASADQQGKWATNYGTAVQKVTFSSDGTPSVPSADDGPVPVLMTTELTLARSGALDADLQPPAESAQQPFYGTDFTRPLMFINDGGYYTNYAQSMNLTGNQWGVMNETGSYPGQPWLWLYQLWYHVPGWRNSANVDLIAIYMTGLATLLLLFVPFIPGLRDIPRWIPVHRLIWRTPAS